MHGIDSARVTLHRLKTHDHASVDGILTTVPGAKTVVVLAHPRQDATHHPLVPHLLRAGAAVWTQHPRSVNNDLTLVHEQALLDIAAGLRFLRERDFDSIVALGHSGGGPLFAYYLEQAGLPPSRRVHTTPAGGATALADAEMPAPDGVVFLAPHRGQGQLLLSCIDPSVTDEHDAASVAPELDLYALDNGFREPPEIASYSEEFLVRYRQAQRARLERIDAVAREYLRSAASARSRYESSGDVVDLRCAHVPYILTVFRTDADPRTVDLSIDPNDRPYGSVYGRRPDRSNYGLPGFGRLTTPEAWLSTWSGLSSQADFVRCAPAVTIPTLYLELTGDQVAFPSDARRMIAALAALDLVTASVRGRHFGGPIERGEPTGTELAAKRIARWLAKRFVLAPA